MLTNLNALKYLLLPVARNQNLECVYFGGNKNSIAGITTQGTKFKTTQRRISSRTLQTSQNSTLHRTQFQNSFDTNIRKKKFNEWALPYTFHMQCSPVRETGVISNKITQPSRRLFQLLI
jgi:hypothetical protein